MINFRYHLVSLVAVFLALGVGVIMGTAVIDSAVVDRLEAQQRTLDRQVAGVREDNARLETELGALGEVADRLVEEGVGRLRDVPILVVAIRGDEIAGLERLREQVGTAGGRLQGTLWLTDRWSLEDSAAISDLREAAAIVVTSAGQVRAEGLATLALALRPTQGTPVSPTPERDLLRALQQRGFVEFEAPEGQPDELAPLAQGTRLVLVSPGAGADVADRQLALPLARALVGDSPDRAPAPLVVATSDLPDDDDADQLVLVLRRSEEGEGRLSTVDNLAEEAGRIATVLALADTGRGIHGHFGRGPEASSLLPPAPAIQTP